MKIKNFAKKIFIIFALIAFTFLVSACKITQAGKVPLGGLTDDIIVKSDYGNITEKQAYELLRNKPADVLNRMIEIKVLDEYIKKIDYNKKEHKEYLTKKFNKTVFGEDDVKKLRNLSPDHIWKKFINFKNSRNYLTSFPINKLEEYINELITLKQVIKRDGFIIKNAYEKPGSGSLMEADYDKLNENYKKLVDDKFFENYSEELLSLEKIALAKKIIAYEYLTNPQTKGKNKGKALIDIEKDSNFISEDNILSEFKDNYKNKYNVNFFAVSFFSQHELDQLLMNNGVEFDSTGNQIKGDPIKIDGNGNYAKIPDIRTFKKENISLEDTRIYVEKEGTWKKENGYNETYEWSYLAKFLNESLIDRKIVRNEIKTPQDVVEKGLNKKEFELYYAKYSINYNRTKGKKDAKLSHDEILKLFVSLHNKVRNSGPELKVEVHADANKFFKIEGTMGEAYKYEYTYEDLKENKLKDYIYNDLKIEYKEDGSLNTEKSSFYSTKLTNEIGKGSKGQGGRYYLVYKIWDDRKDTIEKYYDYKDNKFRKDETLNNDAAAKAKLEEVKKEIREKLIDKKISDSLISERYNKFIEEKLIFVCDPIVRQSFSIAKIKFSTKKYFIDNNTIAQIGNSKDSIKISVKDYFNEIFAKHGIATLVNYLTNQFIYKKYSNKDLENKKDVKKLTAEDKKDAENSLKSQLNQFAQGFDNSYLPEIGRDIYLRHKFGFEKFEDALEHNLYIEKTKKYFNEELSTFIEDYYSKISRKLSTYYDQMFKMKASHILFSVDDNLDGEPDNPDSLTTERTRQIQNAISLVLPLLKVEVSKGTGNLKDNIKDVINNYKTASRFVYSREHFSSDDEFERYKKTGDYIFGAIKKANINISFEELGDIDHKGFEKFDERFFKYVTEMWARYKSFDKKDFPIVDFVSNSAHYEDTRDPGDPDKEQKPKFGEVRTGFGWHCLIVENIEKPKSAKSDKEYTSEHLESHPNEPFKVPINSNDEASREQIECYIKESATNYGVKIPNNDAIKEQIDDVVKKLNTLSELGYLITAKQLNLDFIKYASEYSEFVDIIRDSFDGNSKYNGFFEKLWFKAGTEKLSKFFGLDTI